MSVFADVDISFHMQLVACESHTFTVILIVVILMFGAPNEDFDSVFVQF